MTLIDRSFRDSAWYWAPTGKPGADGVPRFEPAVMIAPPTGGRWDDNPSTFVGTNGEQVAINVKFTTRFPVANGGWLLKPGAYDKDPATAQPSEFPLAREIHTVGTFKNFARSVTFYQANLK